MELANGKHNKFFTLKNKGENRYYLENFDEEKTKGQSNVYILANEIENNSIVLDVGCAQGRFGKILSKKQCTTYGVDLDSEAIKYAENSGYYNKVFNIDITNNSSKDYIDFENYVKKVDVVIISDVFEHISDPTKLLIQCSKLLKENGIMLISVPNIAHIDILLNLMNDKFNYQDVGILDNTHLKFFTKTSFIEWIIQVNTEFHDINFDCEYLGATFYNNDFINYVKETYSELFNIMGKSENYNALQIMFKITKISNQKQPIELRKLEKMNQKDVVSILGEALNGKVNIEANNNIVKGERIWYEEKIENSAEAIKEKDKYIQALEDSLKWYRESEISNDRKHIEKDKYIETLEDSLNWYRENEISNQSKNTEKDKYIKTLEGTVEWHVKNNIEREELYEQEKSKLKEETIELRKKVFNIENSCLWRLTKFLRK